MRFWICLGVALIGIQSSAMSCGDRLLNPELVYIKLIDRCLRADLVTSKDISSLEAGQLINPLEKSTVRAADLPLRTALSSTLRKLNGRLSAEAWQKVHRLLEGLKQSQVSEKEAGQDARKLLKVKNLGELPSAKVIGMAKDGDPVFYLDQEQRPRWMRLKEEGSIVRLASIGPDPEVREIPSQIPAARFRSTLFAHEGQPFALSAVIERDPSNGEDRTRSYLTDLEKGTRQSIDLLGSKPQIDILHQDGRTWVVFSSARAIQTFEMQRGELIEKATIERPDLRLFQVFLTQSGNIKVVGRGTDSLVLYEPLKQTSPTRAWKNIEMLDTFTAHLDDLGEIEICALAGNRNTDVLMFRESRSMDSLPNPLAYHYMQDRSITWSKTSEGVSLAVIRQGSDIALMWPHPVSVSKIEALPQYPNLGILIQSATERMESQGGAKAKPIYLGVVQRGARVTLYRTAIE